MMLSPKFWIFSAFVFIVNVQADMIAWNRLRNNAAKHHCKRNAIFSKADLMAQCQTFFTKNGQNSQNDDALQTRLLFRALQNQKH